MELHQIKYFVALCEELSFTRAAKRCGVSQPSLTNGIKALEAAVGGELFTRRPSIAVTRLGSAVRPCLMRIAGDAEKVLGMAHTFKQDRLRRVVPHAPAYGSETPDVPGA